jgi:hypothetical protein
MKEGIAFILLFCRTLFGHTNFQFNHKGDKKVDNSGGLCSMGSMSEGKERIVTEHPKAWVLRMVEGRGLKVAEKTLYWWAFIWSSFRSSVGARVRGQAKFRKLR